MKISNDTEQVLGFLDYTTGNNLRKRNDIAVLLEIGAKFGDIDEFQNILLIGSSLWNIENTIRRPEQENIHKDKLHLERQNHAEKLQNVLMKFIKDTDTETQNRFEKIYFQNNTGAIKNLIDLAFDISELNNVKKTIKSKPPDFSEK